MVKTIKIQDGDILEIKVGDTCLHISAQKFLGDKMGPAINIISDHNDGGEIYFITNIRGTIAHKER